MLKRVANYVSTQSQFRRVYRKFKPYTMVPEGRYYGNLRLALDVHVEGAIVECGTWRGGMIGGIADVLGSKRSYYLCDSFQGLPPAQEIDGDAARAWQADTAGPHYHNNCLASEDEARRAMAMSRARDYTIVSGWFEETLPKFPQAPIALLRLDADWYESTKHILENLASRVVPGGLVIIDDYYDWIGCAIATNEFAARSKWRIRQNGHGVCFVQVER